MSFQNFVSWLNINNFTADYVLRADKSQLVFVIAVLLLVVILLLTLIFREKYGKTVCASVISAYCLKRD